MLLSSAVSRVLTVARDDNHRCGRGQQPPIAAVEAPAPLAALDASSASPRTDEGREQQQPWLDVPVGERDAHRPLTPALAVQECELALVVGEDVSARATHSTPAGRTRDRPTAAPRLASACAVRRCRRPSRSRRWRGWCGARNRCRRPAASAIRRRRVRPAPRTRPGGGCRTPPGRRAGDPPASVSARVRSWAHDARPAAAFRPSRGRLGRLRTPSSGRGRCPVRWSHEAARRALAWLDRTSDRDRCGDRAAVQRRRAGVAVRDVRAAAAGPVVRPAGQAADRRVGARGDAAAGVAPPLPANGRRCGHWRVRDRPRRRQSRRALLPWEGS